jgi:hypothetical protein
MGEGYLLSPYGNPTDLVVGDIAQGHHATRPDSVSKSLAYEADLTVRGVVPALFATDLILDKPPPIFGPRLPSPEGPLRGLNVHTPGFGFSDAVLADAAVQKAADGAAGMIKRIVIHPQGLEHARLTVLAAPANDAKRVGRVIALVRALATRMHELALENRMFPDAWEALRARGLTGEPGEDRMREVKALVEELTRLTHGTTERVGDGLETRLSALHSGLELEGTLVARWCDAQATHVDVAFQGALPPVDVAEVRMTSPEPSGLLSVFKTWGEVEIGDRALDDAFLIEGEARAAPTIVHARAELLALVPYSARVMLTGGSLSVRLAFVPANDDKLRPVVDALLEMWRRTALLRSGVRDVSDDNL